MHPRITHTRVLKFLAAPALCALLGFAVQPLHADDAKPPARAAQKARVDRQALQQEIMAQPQGIHKLSDGSTCIKSGRGMAIVHADGHGCGTGPTGNPAPANHADGDLMAGVWVAFFISPQESAKLGIGPDQAGRIKDAFNFMDHEGTNPMAVLKIYDQYAKAPDGKAKSDAEKALMDKVRAVGQAFADAEVKKLKDVKALLTQDQVAQLRVMGAKMLRPSEKPLD